MATSTETIPETGAGSGNEQYKQKFGSLPGLIIIVAIGFALYFGMKAIGGMHAILSYEEILGHIKNGTATGHLYWFFMNFTEPDFYGGLVSAIFILVGGFVAWLLAVKKTKWAGFEICYGQAKIWPWVFASQILSLVLTLYAFQFITMFHTLELSWVPTFIVLVSVPPSMVLMYGPGVKTLVTASVIGAAICTPAAYWINQAITTLAPMHTKMPIAVANVLAMAITGIIAASVCHVLPWMKKTEIPMINNTNAPKEKPYSAKWLMRRTITDLSEPLFYGSDIASGFLIVGVILEWILNNDHSTGGAAAIPAILLSQIISGAVGVFLYTNKYIERGWYATYVPVVCIAPACVLLFGDTIPVILFSSILGAIIGAPLAEEITDRLPKFIHPTVANVTSMGVGTIMVVAVMQCMPWFTITI